MLIPGGGLSGSTIAGIRGGSPFNTIDAFKGEFRCKSCQTPVLVLPDDTAGHSLTVAIESAMLAPKGQLSMYPWKDTPEKIPVAVRHVRSFLLSHRQA